MRRLARLRVPVGFALGMLVLLLAQPTATSVAWGASIACVGEALRMWAAGHLSKAREVTTTGPYRWFAHPLYIGSSILGVGLALASESLAATLIISVYLAVMLAAAVKSEESYLRGAFGDRYDWYRRSKGTGPVGEGADSASGSANRIARHFSLAQAMANREHRTMAGIVVALLLLFLKATYNGLFWRAAAGR